MNQKRASKKRWHCPSGMTLLDLLYTIVYTGFCVFVGGYIYARYMGTLAWPNLLKFAIAMVLGVILATAVGVVLAALVNHTKKYRRKKRFKRFETSQHKTG